MSMAACNDASGSTSSARRRGERRLRAYLRYARMSVAMALAECQHHSAQRRKKARAREEEREVAVGAAGPSDGGSTARRGASCGPCPVVQVLDVPVPQKGEELADILLNESDNDGRMAILMVTGYAQGPCAKELRRQGVKHSRARCPTYNRINETH